MNNKYKKIKVCSFDVDGTLTDGVYDINEHGLITKSFYTRDFYGIELLIKAGIKVIIITSSKDNVIEKRIERLKDGNIFWHETLNANNQLMIKTGCRNKKKFMEEVFKVQNIAHKDNQLSFDNLAHMGDAENDLECIKLARFSGCPTDAIPDVRTIAMYPSDYYGGKGAVHDFCMYIIEQRNKELSNENSES